jgi:hypothetical protein
VLFCLLAAAVMAAVFWMSGRPYLELAGARIRPSGTVGNLAHVATFALIGHLLARACDQGARPAGLGARAGRAAFSVAAAFGLSDEVHQFFTPGRVCSAYDLVLDGLGAAVALLAPPLRGPGRPRSWLPALACLAVAIALAALAGTRRPPGDLAIESALRALGLAGG